MLDYHKSSAWPFEEARKLLERAATKSIITFETGYGPSGLPHIGTFGEVVRTSMVRHAFSCLSDVPSRLLCFSDDMDGLRKVPDNIPNKDKMAAFLNFPLTSVPDPFGEFASFGEQNNNRLKKFLDNLGYEYTFMSSTECYKAGMFDEELLSVLHNHKKILDIILPTLREERRKTYSPFLPISPSTGRVLQIPMEEYRETTVIFRDEDGKLTELPVIGGHCKLQWKVDWGMRWKALGIDYEMAGKDLIDSVTLASKVCETLGGVVPENLICEHFLDNEGQKISKSKGNGLEVDEWLKYAPNESLVYFMYNSPRRAKRLYFDIIPKCVDEYLTHLDSYHSQNDECQINNPVWHIHKGQPPSVALPVTFTLLLNLASACQSEDKKYLRSFVEKSHPDLSKINNLLLDSLIDHAVTYYRDMVAPYKKYRLPTDIEKQALESLSKRLDDVKCNPDDIQQAVYEIGKEFFQDLKSWFSCFYEVVLGQVSGPRVGSFIALYGIDETKRLIDEKTAGPKENNFA